MAVDDLVTQAVKASANHDVDVDCPKGDVHHDE